MASIEDIWDEPVEESIGSRPTPPTSRSKDPLFLADSDDDEQLKTTVVGASDMDVDIDAMFAGVEDEDVFSFKPLTGDIDTEALRRKEEAKHRQNMPPLTPHQIMSSSPPRDMGNDGEAGGKGRKDDGKEGKKERRRPARLDEGKLLGPDGFPALIKEVKRFKPKGKGHEAGDLDRLLRIYGYWTHALYPKTPFKDTVERVEKLCHSKRMHVALSVWKDEWHGRNGGQRPNNGDSDDEELFGKKGSTNDREGTRETPAPSSDGLSEPPSSATPSRPPSDTEGDDFDEFDIDEIIRAEEQRAAEEAKNHGGRRTRNLVVDSDDEQPPAEFISGPPRGEGASKLNSGLGDDDMWDILDEMNGPPPKGPKVGETEASHGTNTSVAMEVDEYDIEDMYA